MISETLIFFRSTLNEYLQTKSSSTLDDMHEDHVVFLEGDKVDPVSFKMEAVTLLLVNLEEENTLRAADPYIRSDTSGSTLATQPDVRLNLYILFVAKFKQYEKSLNYISLIIQFFQSNRTISHQNSPSLNSKIEKLSVELMTLPFGEQNEIWSSLRTTYHPSVLYKVKMLVYTDEDALPPPEVGSKDLTIGNIGVEK